MLYIEKEKEHFPVKMAVVVPKKLIKKAVDRNLLKRRIREAYRLYKGELYNNFKSSEKQYNLMILYQSEEILDYNIINKQVRKTLDSIVNPGNNNAESISTNKTIAE